MENCIHTEDLEPNPIGLQQQAHRLNFESLPPYKCNSTEFLWLGDTVKKRC